ncbi:Fc receptor-like protein 5 isoform X3 [Stegostoma tigrinum]|uniref:Fc receptor-like protein 5 isoform X3 n=1 Tax=Stegostoma tigrinum TaxID=3053191 RepID=UPI00202B50E9|nr:Fc receptor-like protein 5 isoform X3 [Stegostoma tigrinum]
MLIDQQRMTTQKKKDNLLQMMGIYSDLLLLFTLTQYATCQKLAGQLSNPTIQGPERVHLNDTKTISCFASSEKPSMLYSLYRDKTLVEAQNISTSEPANFSVSFYSQNDGGTYKCKVESDDAVQRKYSNSINIIVLAPVLGVSITSVPDPPVLKVHDKLTLNCIVKQGSSVTYQWYFNEQELLSTSSIKINQSSLVINHALSNNTGHYQCQASNQFSETTFKVVSNSTEVIVKVPASNPDIFVDVNFVRKDTMFITVKCLSHEGTLPITYTLYINTSFVKDYDAQSRREGQFIVPVPYTDKLGTFKCKATNGFDSKYSNGLDVDLSVKLTSKPDPPIQGHQVTLNCNVTYQTNAKYTWYFVHSKENSTESTKQNQFTHVANHPGRYYCSINGQTSNWIEVLSQDSSLQPVTIAISVAVTVLLILVLGLICYCIFQKAVH